MTELVLVPVLLHNSAGDHIAGLTQEKFQLLDGGKPRKIAVFDEVRPAEVSNGPQRPLGVYGNYVANPESARRVTIILIDLLSLTNFPAAPELVDQTSFERVRKQIIEHLSRNVDPNEPVSLMVLNTRGLKQIHNFTTDTKVLIASLNQLKQSISIPTDPDITPLQTGLNTKDANIAGIADAAGYLLVGETVAALSSATSEQLADLQRLRERMIAYDELRGLEFIARSYRSVPGRKSLVWVCAGYPWPVGLDLPTLGRPKDALGESMIRDSSNRIFEMLADSNVAVYPIDMIAFRAPGRRNSIADPRTVSPDVPSLDFRRSLHDTLRIVAETTGGRPCLNNNDATDCLQKVSRDSGSYYLLGFYLPAKERNSGQHKLTVKVDAKYSDLRYRQSYTAGKSDPSEDPNAALRQAYSSPLDLFDLPFDFKISSIVPSGGKRKVTIAIAVTPASIFVDPARDNLAQIEFSANAFDEQGRSVNQVSKTLKGNLKTETAERIAKEGLVHNLELELAPGRYLLRCVVRDDLTGRLGSASAHVQID